MDTPYGPHKITQVRQVLLPADLLRELGLSPGDQVYLRLSPEDRETIQIIPATVFVRRLERGTDAEALDELVAKDTTDTGDDTARQEG